MNRAQVVTLTRQWLGFNQALTDAIIYAHFDSVQAELEYEDLTLPRPWFIFDDDATMDTEEDVRFVAVPAGFIDLDEDYPMQVLVEGVSKPLRRDMHGHLLNAKLYDANQIDVLEGYPQFYSFDGNNFQFFPRPDAVYTITVPHYAKSALLSESATHAWFEHFPTFVAMKTASSIMRANRDEQGFQYMGSKLDMQHAKYLATLEVKRHRQMDYYFGSE